MAAWLVFFTIHFTFVGAASFRALFWELGSGAVLAPQLNHYWRAAEDTMAVALGERLKVANAYREAVALYLHATGTETGYGYFAPGVPDNYKLVFEIHYFDGRVEYALPTVGSEATGLRLVNLLDCVQHAVRPEIRALEIQMLAQRCWEEHPGASRIRAVFGALRLPSVEEFKRGQGERYVVLFASEFTFMPSPEPLHAAAHQ